jgi:hypothetical protein
MGGMIFVVELIADVYFSNSRFIAALSKLYDE